MTGDAGLVEVLSSGDPLSAPLARVDKALIAFAIQLTVAPATITVENIAPLRAAGLDDRAIHDLCQVVAYFAYVNRVADGLGVELEGCEST